MIKDQPSARHLKTAISLCLAILVLVVFWQAQYNDFIDLDDNIYIYENGHVQEGLTLKNLYWAFTNDHAGFWFPLTWLTHMADVELYGLNPKGHHLNNLLLHLINTLLLFLFLSRVAGATWRSGFVAVLFALHPLRVESVAWAAERKDVLSAFFFLLTLWSYFYYTRRPRLARYAIVLFFFVMGLMSKPMVVTIPFLLLLLDYWPLRRFQRDMRINSRKISVPYLFLEKLPLLILSAALCYMTIRFQQNQGALVSVGAIPIKFRIANAVFSYVEYIRLMIWPRGLAVFYPHSIHMAPLWQILIYGLLLLVISLLSLFTLRNHAYLFVGWFWYIGTLVPTIGLVQSGVQAMADRFTYIPMIGLFLIVSWGGYGLSKKLPYQKLFLFLPASVIILSLMLCTLTQVSYWKNSVTLLEHALRVTRGNGRANHLLGNILTKQGFFDKALYHYSEALSINPYDASTHNDLGVCLAKQGKIADSINHFSEAVRIKPDYLKAQYNLGYILSQEGRYEEAILHYRAALEIAPDFYQARHNLERILQVIETNK